MIDLTTPTLRAFIEAYNRDKPEDPHRIIERIRGKFAVTGKPGGEYKIHRFKVIQGGRS